MAMETSSKSGWYRSCIGFELCVQGLKGGKGRFARDLGQQLVLKVGVFDTGSLG